MSYCHSKIGSPRSIFWIACEKIHFLDRLEGLGYGRATVALTRARSLCVILGPLDMKGLLGAATVIGSLMYGAGHVFKGQANFYMDGGSFRNPPSDAEFGHLLARSNCLTSPELPPLAIAEALQDNVSHWYKIRRLHLIIVDTWSPWQ